jgi:hypothetical protein
MKYVLTLCLVTSTTFLSLLPLQDVDPANQDQSKPLSPPAIQLSDTDELQLADETFPEIQIHPYVRQREIAFSIFYSPEEKVTMLGVHVRSPDNTLRKHLKIKPGLGLIVEQVVAGSAAAEAGLAVDDVLLRFADQLLVNENQLTTLVRNSELGERVTLSIIREGSPQTIEVELSEGVASTSGGWMNLSDHHHGALDLHQHMTNPQFANCATCHRGVTSGTLKVVPVLSDDKTILQLMPSLEGSKQD